jgi:hypothetical protein
MAPARPWARTSSAVPAKFSAEIWTLVSAPIRVTLPAAADLLDGTLDVGLGHLDFPGPTLSIALKRTPTTLVNVPAKRLADEVRGK